MSELRMISPTWSHFELHGLEHHGNSLDFVWAWPNGVQSLSLAAVMQAMGLGDDDLLGALQFCNLQQMGAQSQPIWVLGNSSRDVLCSVNLRTLSAGQQVRLEHGDHIEVGLTRLQVCMQAEPLTGVANAKSGLELLDTFDLTDLARTSAPYVSAQSRADAAHRSDFSDLIALEPQTAQAPQALQAPQAAPMQPIDPLDALHAQYLRKIRDPLASDQEDLWADVSRGESALQADPMQSLMDAAGARAGLDDLLGQPQSIASVINSLNTLGATDLLDPEPYASVMHLFAPENLRQQEQDSLESIVRRSLPGLTRREHHSLSVDSAMPDISDAQSAPADTKTFKYSP